MPIHSSPTPIKISRTDDKHLTIQWSDGRECLYLLSELRKRCPCATCLTEARSKSDSFIPLFTRDAITLASIEPQGYYALKFIWKDGHSTGIYPYSLLLSFCKSPADNE